MRLPILAASLALAAATPGSSQAAGGQPFRVFFDWGKPELTRDAEAILNDAATAYQRASRGRVTVAGHTDRSGSSAYNLAASRRRAEAVKAYLVARGIPASAIAVSAYGESQPIIPTEDGVREVQNRRVEISFDVGTRSPVANGRSAPIVDATGKAVGTATMVESPEGTTLVVEAQGLPPGIHAMHLHSTGRCDFSAFASAGPHWNPTNRQHGTQNPQGPHLGDLPEIIVGTGIARAEVKVPAGSLDGDGVALVVHASPDDDRTDPGGNSGVRIACAAFNP